ncbi:MAG: DUF192 domain-containing protein [Holosporales bacterium]
MAVFAVAGGFAQSLALPRQSLALQTPMGEKVFHVEIVQSESARQQGLMHRDSLLPDQGMLFVFNPPAPAHFWMKDTLVALDMLFMDDHGRLVCLRQDAQPHDLKPYSCKKNVAFVIEVPAGTAARLQLQLGDHLVKGSDLSWILNISSPPPGTNAIP